ncbi:MAG: phosphomethylpyrimidine synthase ThiC, partial [Methanobrevibacter sp.]|nr:phosphomethylpyrimidine synthase ThiC [Methanobrevibacter sp.]
MTQMTEAKKGNITPEMKAVSEFEKIDAYKIMKGLANGTI